MLMRPLLLALFLLGLPSLASAQTPTAGLETGDQAEKEIANGFFLDSEVGLLTYLPGIGDGAQIYRGGLFLSLNMGGSISKSVRLYGKIAGGVLDNTRCSRDPVASECRNTYPYPTIRAGRRPLARQGASAYAGLGVRWSFFNLEDRFLIYLIGEALLHIVPPDNIPNNILESEKEQIPEYRKRPAIGGAVGIGIGGEYFFLMKHFSLAVNIIYYFDFTQFMEGANSRAGALAGFLGHAVLASASLKYTF